MSPVKYKGYIKDNIWHLHSLSTVFGIKYSRHFRVQSAVSVTKGIRSKDFAFYIGSRPTFYIYELYLGKVLMSLFHMCEASAKASARIRKRKFFLFLVFALVLASRFHACEPGGVALAFVLASHVRTRLYGSFPVSGILRAGGGIFICLMSS